MSDQQQQGQDPKELEGQLIRVPDSQVLLVLGVDKAGRLYHQAFGNTGLVEIAGLMAYGNHVVTLGFEHATRVPSGGPRLKS